MAPPGEAKGVPALRSKDWTGSFGRTLRQPFISLQVLKKPGGKKGEGKSKKMYS